MKPNFTHYLLLIYFDTQPLHVAGVCCPSSGSIHCIMYGSLYVPTQRSGHAVADLGSSVLESGFKLDCIVHPYIVDHMSYSLGIHTPSNTTNTYISLRCKRQHVSALSSHHQANLIYISLVHKVYVHVIAHTLYVLS
jgi:hypothetical protein